jgi:glycosyltransferase involved in cell wall biosynthesis
MNKLISVILPVYNSEKYISEAIQSVLDQTYSNFELLVFDDGSTDNTLSIINDFQDDRIKIFTSDKNYGIVHQLNKGIDNSNGQYIARMDADDISYPDRFQKQIDCLNTNPHIDVMGTFAKKIGEDAGLIEYKYNKPEQISFLLNFYCYMLHPTVMMRKRIFSKCKYSSDYPLAEDYGLWCQINNGSNLYILDEVLLDYRIHNEQTNKSDKRLKVQYDSVLKVKKDIKFNGLFCNFIFTDELNKASTNYFVKNESLNQLNLSIIEKFYFRIKLRLLKVQLFFLNQLLAN